MPVCEAARMQRGIPPRLRTTCLCAFALAARMRRGILPPLRICLFEHFCSFRRFGRLLGSYVARRFHSGETEAPLLLAASSPPATIDPALYLPPALRCCLPAQLQCRSLLCIIALLAMLPSCWRPASDKV